MNIPITKKNMPIWIILTYIIPIIITIVMLLQWDSKNAIVMGIIIAIIWIIAIIITFSIIKEVKKNPYPLSYLVDYDTLIKYMYKEEEISINNNLEAGFHYYIYQNNVKNEVQAWHYTFSTFESEKNKGNIYYWNKEEYNSVDSLIENKIKNIEGYILIELIDSDNEILNEYKKNHPELDVNKYMENLNK